MILQISIETLLAEFLLKHQYDDSLIVRGPISLEEREFIADELGIPVFKSNGEYLIFTKVPIGSYSGIRGWLWVNQTLVELA